MWYYNDKLYEATPEEFQGFVYEITELDTNKKYIGKKNFWKPKTLPITKKRKRRVRTRAESDWKQYYGSSNEVCTLVEERGTEKFKRVILKLCKTKGDMSYHEAKLQFDNNVLLNDEYFNNFIGCKIHSKHLTC
jgi:hypothetical protein|tara:strand:+ start:1365 stop:1766 length:402 start_codon:yes stop_codon:yes gene_type:complete